MSPVAAPAWSSIESAPKDEEILVFTPPWGPIIALYDSEFGQWLSRMQSPAAIVQDDEKPTHWMRLPEPPPGFGAESREAGEPSGDGNKKAPAEADAGSRGA
jgi:hypothetical protein